MGKYIITYVKTVTVESDIDLPWIDTGNDVSFFLDDELEKAICSGTVTKEEELRPVEILYKRRGKPRKPKVKE